MPKTHQGMARRQAVVVASRLALSLSCTLCASTSFGKQVPIVKQSCAYLGPLQSWKQSNSLGKQGMIGTCSTHQNSLKNYMFQHPTAVCLGANIAVYCPAERGPVATKRASRSERDLPMTALKSNFCQGARRGHRSHHRACFCRLKMYLLRHWVCRMVNSQIFLSD